MTAWADVMPAAGRPWRRAVVWLGVLAPVLYLTSGAASWHASRHVYGGSIGFDWTWHMPLPGWTIVPCWPIGLLYAASFFLCTTPTELDRHGKRLLTAQILLTVQMLAVACFLLFPLWAAVAAVERPETAGLAEVLFNALTSFDGPFDQAPSLQTALLVVLWDLYARHTPPGARWPLHVGFALVGVSVLLTHQSHFAGVPAGTLLGFLCLWLWPERGPGPVAGSLTREPKRVTLALCYAAGAAALAAAGLASGAWGLWLIWPAASLLLVAANYAFVGADGFQKGPDGALSLAARWLFAPYILTAWINSRIWTWREASAVPIADGVWLGRIPSAAETSGRPFAATIDCCAELPLPKGYGLRHVYPILDLVRPSPRVLRAAATAIEEARRNGPVLVCCALGYARSASAVAAWLVITGRARDASRALKMIRVVRPGIVVDNATRAAIVNAAGAL